jgi:hypothetical protein
LLVAAMTRLFFDATHATVVVVVDRFFLAVVVLVVDWHAFAFEPFFVLVPFFDVGPCAFWLAPGTVPVVDPFVGLTQPEQDGGGGGGAAPATKQPWRSTEPGILMIASIAMLTSALDRRAYRSCGAISWPLLTA